MLCLHGLVFKADRPELALYSDRKALDRTGFCSDGDYTTAISHTPKFFPVQEKTLLKGSSPPLEEAPQLWGFFP